MATITKRDLAKRALGRVGVLDPVEEPSAEDYALAFSFVQAVFSELAGLTLVVPVTAGGDEHGDTLDVRYMAPLRDLVAFHIAPDFAKPQDLAQKEMAMSALRSQLETAHDFEPVQFTDY